MTSGNYSGLAGEIGAFSAGPRACDGEVLRLTGLRRVFGDTVAVDGVDLVLHPGELFGFLWPNGAGKTTTIRMATGLLRTSRGAIQVFGLDPFRNALEVKAQVGVVPEEVPLYERLSGRESLELAGRLHLLDPVTARRRADALLLVKAADLFPACEPDLFEGAVRTEG